MNKRRTQMWQPFDLNIRETEFYDFSRKCVSPKALGDHDLNNVEYATGNNVNVFMDTKLRHYNKCLDKLNSCE